MPDNTPYIVSAFALTWIVLLGYAFFLWRARAEAERRIEQLTQDATSAGVR